MSYEIVLTETECMHVALEACQRRIRKFAKGTQDSHKHGYGGKDNWTVHIEAAGAEAAVAKVMDLFWLGSPDPDYAGDVGELHVRHTPRIDGRLIVHKSDPAHGPFILVTGAMPTYYVDGWMFAADAQNEKYWTDPGTGRPTFFVPQEDLRDISELRDCLKEVIA